MNLCLVDLYIIQKKNKNIYNVGVTFEIMRNLIKNLFGKLFPNTFGKSVSRISLDNELKKHFKKLNPGIILDVGSKHSPYRKYVHSVRYMRLDFDSEDNPDICCDLHEIKWQSNYFDTVIATEVLEHLHDPEKAIREIYRVLKKGGNVLLSTRFIYPYHPDPKDYYRFTWDSLTYLFRHFDTVEVCHHGNRFQLMWEMIISDCGKIGIPFRILMTPLIAKIHFKKTKYPCGFVVYAKK